MDYREEIALLSFVKWKFASFWNLFYRKSTMQMQV